MWSYDFFSKTKAEVRYISPLVMSILNFVMIGQVDPKIFAIDAISPWFDNIESKPMPIVVNLSFIQVCHVLSE